MVQRRIAISEPLTVSAYPPLTSYDEGNGQTLVGRNMYTY